jgi:hypothetical protein
LTVTPPPGSATVATDLPKPAPAHPRLVVAQAPSGRAQDVRPQATTRIDFGQDDEVVGEIQSPDGADVEGPPPPARWHTLVEIPRDFVTSFEKMVEDSL